jgi:hypothetical protein
VVAPTTTQSIGIVETVRTTVVGSTAAQLSAVPLGGTPTEQFNATLRMLKQQLAEKNKTSSTQLYKEISAIYKNLPPETKKVAYEYLIKINQQIQAMT